MGKTIWSYAVVQSIFGGLWVGKSKRKADNKQYFSDIKKAIDVASQMFEDMNLDFDSSLEEDEAGFDYELAEAYTLIIDATEDNAEEIKKGMEKFVV